MVRIQSECPDSGRLRIELLANLSLTLDGLAGFFLILSTVTLGAALLPTVLGYWPVMAIAMAHLLLVGWCLRLAWRGNWMRQDIDVGTDEIVVTTTTAKACRVERMPARWVRIRICREGRQQRVYVAIHGRALEVGGFLPEGERAEAARCMVRALRNRSAWTESYLTETVSSG